MSEPLKTLYFCLRCGRVQGENKDGSPAWLHPPKCFNPKPELEPVGKLCPYCEAETGQQELAE